MKVAVRVDLEQGSWASGDGVDGWKRLDEDFLNLQELEV
jgi:hypothetical protein